MSSIQAPFNPLSPTILDAHSVNAQDIQEGPNIQETILITCLQDPIHLTLRVGPSYTGTETTATTTTDTVADTNTDTPHIIYLYMAFIQQHSVDLVLEKEALVDPYLHRTINIMMLDARWTNREVYALLLVGFLRCPVHVARVVVSEVVYR
jgi:hypothetical protein